MDGSEHIRSSMLSMNIAILSTNDVCLMKSERHIRIGPISMKNSGLIDTTKKVLRSSLNKLDIWSYMYDYHYKYEHESWVMIY
jgi:hypothetical protein